MEKASDHEGNERKAGRSAPASREERLAAALRENLRKRKAQARARNGGDGPAGGPDPDQDPGQDPA
ncbi:MAG TPA: hypothetical protein VLR47_13230 [Rhodospirillales bacterium]|nr:hypothetical protein [Rhodospirillales bacterium]